MYILTDTEQITCKQKALETYFQALNPQQQEAVFTVNGPVLVLAGAGSGKTTVIIHRIVNMIYFGDGYMHPYADLSVEDQAYLSAYINGTEPADEECLRKLLAVHPIQPYHILAITFTNKAADEMRTRLESVLGADTVASMQVSTFHAACVRILHQSIDKLGYQNNFTIYDDDDTKRLLKKILQENQLSEQYFRVSNIMRTISRAKDNMQSPEEMHNAANGDYQKTTIATIYAEYQRQLKEANALDFDDIIYLTVKLFTEFPDTLSYYQNRYRYILVDEYQDTNHAQYQLVSLLSQAYGNLCVVGDDDQSIYRFRGANIENILSFENQFTNCHVIRLEHNYRSTQRILNAANDVISHNYGRKPKHLWTDAGDGDLIIWYQAYNDREEANYIVRTIQQEVQDGGQYADHAILYRMNVQSRQLEQALKQKNVPYYIYSGTGFYERKEVKDILAYMCITENPYDSVRLQRIINVPKRGIGDKTITHIQDISRDLNLSPLEVIRDADAYPILSRKTAPLKEFAQLWDDLRQASLEMPLDAYFDYLLKRTGYTADLEQAQSMATDQEEWDTIDTRLQNIEALKADISEYMEKADAPSLSEYLEHTCLDNTPNEEEEKVSKDRVTLLTVHSAKGLEFSHVYIVGMEQGIFPTEPRYGEAQEDLEEERRLAYVAITRAKKELTITTADSRRLYGNQIMHNEPSQFLDEISPDLFCIQKCQSNAYAPPTRTQNMRTTSSRGSPYTLDAWATKKQTKPQSPSHTQYAVGEHIRHAKFGEGVILSVTPAGNDMLLEVEFQTAGTKKIMANFAKIEKIS